MYTQVILTTIAGAICLPLFAHSEVVEASPAHFTLHLAAETELKPDQVWTRLIEPSSWWLSEHTYSGSADHLSLDAQAGGLWREDWEGGSVAHGTVQSLMEGQSLRLDAPFGPLQGMAVTVIWTITIEPDGDGTRVIFDEVATGSSASGLDQIAPAVDRVKAEAIARLATAPA